MSNIVSDTNRRDFCIFVLVPIIIIIIIIITIITIIVSKLQKYPLLQYVTY